MSDSEPDSFDDPGLKAAIRRAWGAEQCPPSLRDRVMIVGKDAIGETTPVAGGMRISRPLYWLAAVAIVLIVIGLAIHFHTVPQQQTQKMVLATALPTNLADELIARHDECCAASDHHMPGLSRDNFPDIQKELHQQLGFPILAAQLPAPWNFHGASVCPVGTTKSGHLVFDQGGKEFLSIFSLPHEFASRAYLTGTCSQIEAHHPIAGFATADGFYCLVGSSKDDSLSLDQVKALRDQLRPDLTQVRGAAARLTIVAAP